ncbi:hypothetical protein GUJ93_ZPchr0010g10479 [Zizania palustris]|uniref:Uncharacterized protein n=1 Tax=Zizania palustris TaxID=103762 RepID=A0A8J5WFG7_ZIZPA|nr:hypothetical protein GUJ93_ZPchr0010g10479 [Zizania palustris]
MITTTTHSRHHHAFEKSPNHNMKNMDRKLQAAMSHASKYLQKMYPLGIQRTSSNLTLSSLSLSQNSNDSSLSSSNSSWEPKVPLLYGGTFSPWGDVLVSLERRREDDKASDHDVEEEEDDFDGSTEPGSLRRCSWITKNSDEAYVEFHDECWGVPVYNDKYVYYASCCIILQLDLLIVRPSQLASCNAMCSRLFELLALSGMLIDHNWAEILKRRDMYREAFADFDHDAVAKMDEQDVAEISGNKELKLAECRVRCIIENAKCIHKASTRSIDQSEWRLLE